MVQDPHVPGALKGDVGHVCLYGRQQKFTYTPSTAIALGGISWELEYRVFPWILHTAGQSEAIIWDHVTHA